MLVYLDLRHMRSINRLGDSGAGDAVIAQTLAVLQRWAGDAGFADRLWSNEFVAVKSIDSGESAVDQASTLRAELTAIVYPSTLGSSRVAVSLGLIVVNAGSQDWESLIHDAAEACEAAKHRGLNQIVAKDQRQNVDSSALVNASHVLNFRTLRDQGRLTLHAQPIMDISAATPRLAKAEFLTRMQLDDRVVPLPPGTIDTLEYFGLTTELDRHSVQTLFTWLDQNPELLRHLDGVSLNLSARSIADGHFMDDLYNEVRSLHLPAGKLGFEITETAAIDRLDIAAALVADFRAIGCNFSLDDFGSGLCSFAYLHSLPVDEVKIDGRFVHDIVDNPVSQEIVRAIHQVAKATGKRTVAEFVDEPAKLAVLRSLGVDHAQGWLFHKAMPPEKLLQLLLRRDSLAA
ncbi:MAG TPA: GGDEF domain-containing phosphodiesterase [Fontimonas sp.]